MVPASVILVAEDDENDAWLVKRACEKARIPAELRIVTNGEHARDYLLGHGEYKDRTKHPLPCLVLLDIKMPRLNGLEVLEAVKNDGTSRRIPVVIISSSSQQSDIDKAYDLGANAYLVKPIDFESLTRLFQTIAEFFTKYAAKPHVQPKH